MKNKYDRAPDADSGNPSMLINIGIPTEHGLLIAEAPREPQVGGCYAGTAEPSFGLSGPSPAPQSGRAGLVVVAVSAVAPALSCLPQHRCS